MGQLGCRTTKTVTVTQFKDSAAKNTILASVSTWLGLKLSWVTIFDNFNVQAIFWGHPGKPYDNF